MADARRRGEAMTGGVLLRPCSCSMGVGSNGECLCSMGGEWQAVLE